MSIPVTEFPQPADQPSGTAPPLASESPSRSGRRLLIAGALTAVASAVAFIVARVADPALLSGFDLAVYRDGGELALHNPARLYTWQWRGHPGIKFTYTPFAAVLFAVVDALPFTLTNYLMVIVSIALLAATLWIALRELRWRGRALLGMTLLLTGVTFWFEPVQQALHLGQVEIVLMAAITWDLCQPATRRWKGVATGIAAGIKLVPLLFIVYLLLTRRLRAAAVSAGAFAVTVLAGFAVLPGPSARWWLDGYFLDASKTGFVGASVNQSLRGVITRFAGSVAGGTALWLVAALVVAAIGLWAAVRLHRSGQEFAGLMTCALTALLVCPISWDHHWVWIVPGLALVVDTARRGVSPANQPRPASRRFWILVTACLVGVFAAWPRSHGGHWVWLPGGLLNMVPGSYFPYGDNPGYVEYHWYGSELILGNSYVIAGLCLLGLAVVVGLWADGRPAWLAVPSRHGELRAGRTIGRHTE